MERTYSRLTIAEDSEEILFIESGQLSINTSNLLLAMLPEMRYEQTLVTLPANTWVVIPHNLGKKYVHVTVFSALDIKIEVDLEVEFIGINQIKIRSQQPRVGATVLVSL